MNVVAVRATSQLPDRIPAEMYRASLVAGSGLRHGPHGERLEPEYAPTPSMRSEMQKHLSVLTAALDFRDNAVVRNIVAALLAPYDFGKVSREEAAVIIASYVRSLDDVPVWAVVEAAARWTKGTVAGQRKGYRPSPDELRGAAADIAQPFHEDHAKLRRVLAAPVVAEVIPPKLTLAELQAKHPIKWADDLPSPIQMTKAEKRDLAAKANEHTLRMEREAAGLDASDPLSPGLRRYLEQNPVRASDPKPEDIVTKPATGGTFGRPGISHAAEKEG